MYFVRVVSMVIFIFTLNFFKMNRFLKYFLQGLLLLAPLTLTAFVLVKVFWFLDGLIPKELPLWKLPNQTVHVGDIPGLGIVLLLFFLIFVGFIGSSFIADPIINYFNKLLSKIPLVKVIYDAIKEMLGAFVGNKKKFNHPVIFKDFPDANFYRIGFITQQDLSAITTQTGLCAVYLPHSYALSGMVVFVEVQKLEALEINAAQAMKFIVSGGVINIHDLTQEENV